MFGTLMRLLAPPRGGAGGGFGGSGGAALALPAGPGGGAGGAGSGAMEIAPWAGEMGGMGMGGGATMAPYIPAADVHELSDRFEIRVEAPGAKEDEVDVSVSSGVLTISVHPHPVSKEERDAHGRIVRRERWSSSWSRSFSLPSDAEQEGGEGARAWLERGILCVQVMKKPKEEEGAGMRPHKRIAVTGATGGHHAGPRSPGGAKPHALGGGGAAKEEKEAPEAADGAGAGTGGGSAGRAGGKKK
jgi:HSP20 family molecular chaperone IbpA